MINSINSMAGFMGHIQSTQMQQRQDPLNVFKTVDQDDSGGISASELVTLTQGIEEITGVTIHAVEAMSTYDLDTDGELSGEELFGFMSKNVQPPPPPPPPMQQGQASQLVSMSSFQAASEYERNSGTDKILELVTYLKNQVLDETI